MNPRVLLAILVLTLCASPALIAQETPHASSADSIAIAEVARAFSAAYVRGDPEAMTAAYTDGAVIFPDRVAALSGRQAIQQYWTLPDNRRITQHQILPDAVVIHGGMAYDHGRFTISGTTDGVAWGPSWGKYVVVWQRGTDGKWRMRLDIWNRLDQPAGG